MNKKKTLTGCSRGGGTGCLQGATAGSSSPDESGLSFSRFGTESGTPRTLDTYDTQDPTPPGSFLQPHTPAVLRPLLAACAALLSLSVAACTMLTAQEIDELERSKLISQEEINRLGQQIVGQQETIERLQQQIKDVHGLEGNLEEQLIVPVRIELERMSGAYDRDGQVGDDGIVLYIQPVDRDNHVIKAAGSIEVELFDLANAQSLLIKNYEFDTETTRTLWYGRMMTNHFTVRCPWPPGSLPDHHEITAKVTFTELLTGKVLIAQEVYHVTFSPEPPDRR